MDGVKELDTEVINNIIDEISELEQENISGSNSGEGKYKDSQMIDKIAKIIKREVNKIMG
jgi:hypothetical protein